MKKNIPILFFIIMILFIPMIPTALAVATKRDYYTPYGNDNIANIYLGGNGYAQTFIVGVTGYEITGVELWCYKYAGTTSSLRVSVYATSLHMPTGSALTYGDAVTTGWGAGWGERFIDITGYNLSPSTEYALVFTAPNSSGYGNDINIGYHQANPYNNGNLCLFGATWSIPTANGMSWDFGFEVWGEDILPPNHTLNYVTINGVDMNVTDAFGFWLFRADVYEMKASVSNSTYANMTINDNGHNIVFSYDTTSNIGKVTVTGYSDPNQNMNVIGLVSSSHLDVGVDTVYTWVFIPNNNIIDSYNVTLNYIFGNAITNITGSMNNKINIYNLGGKVDYTFTGDGHHIVGADVFELGATNGATGSSAKATAIFRRLQQVHMLAEWYFSPDIINGESFDDIAGGGSLEYRFDYAIDNVWIEGWKCIITPVDSNVGTHGIGADASWVKFYVQWYNQGALIKSEYIISYNFGYDTLSDFPTDRPTSTMWVDLWYNKMNSSSVVGGRVNAEYHGMYEQTGWWFSSDFRPLYTNVTSSMFFTNLKDEFGDDMSCFNINLVRMSTTLTKYNVAVTNGNLWKTMPYQVFDIKVAGDRMEGINTPVFVETRTLDIPSTGFFAPIVSVIGGIATAIFVSALGFMKVLIGSVDTFLTIFGVPTGTFSSLINMVTGTLLTLMGWFTIAVTQLQNMLMLFGALITNMTTFVNYAVNVLLWTFANVFTMPLQVIALLIAVLNGSSITFYGIFLDFTPYASLMAGAKQILPLTIGIALLSYVIYGNMSFSGDEDMAHAPARVIGLFKDVKEMFDGIFFLYNRIRAFIMNMISAIKAWIPSMSGGMPSGENTV